MAHHGPELVPLRALPSWGPDALEASWGRRRVAVKLGPPVVDPAALALARERAAPWVERSADGILALLGVARLGGREAWLYELPKGVAASLFTAHQTDLPPPAAAVQIVAAVCRILTSLDVRHPGPCCDDLFVSGGGDVVVAGLVGPEEPAAGPAGAEDPRASQVWRVGALLLELMSGGRPGGTTRKVHDASVRRLLIAAMARPGPGVSEELRDLIAQMLGWEAAARPGLRGLGERLSGVATELPPPDLQVWSARFVPALLRRFEAPHELPEPPDPTEVDDDEVLEPTEESDLVVVEGTEEITALSEPSTARWTLPAEHGAIPVDVGPPPEAVPSGARLPSGLFGGGRLDPTAPGSAWFRPGLLLLLTLLLAVVAFGLGFYVMAL